MRHIGIWLSIYQSDIANLMLKDTQNMKIMYVSY